MKEKFKEMIDLQNRLNINTNGENWVNGVTKEGRDINWYRCIYMEAAEAIDSLNWKHWKDLNAPEDIENLKIEIVDIWHFILSQSIVNFGVEEAYNRLYELYNVNDLYDNIFSMEKNTKNIVENLEFVIKDSLSQNIPIVYFFRVVTLIPDFDMNDVYSLYIGKNCLNEFRQKHGYKDGTYKKLWNGKEDNVYMQEIIEKNPNIGFSELYKELEEKYKSIS